MSGTLVRWFIRRYVQRLLQIDTPVQAVDYQNICRDIFFPIVPTILRCYNIYVPWESERNLYDKKYEEQDFTDDFMSCKVLTNNPELCHELLELIISKKVGKFTRLDKQKPIEITADGKGVRFDVYSEDDQNVVYGPFDIFKHGLHKYTFRNYCKELPQLLLDDESTKIFLCAGGDADDVSPEMKEFLDWMINRKKGESKFVKSLDEALKKARNHEKWRLEYMTLLMRDDKMREEGRKEGRRAGREEEIFLSVQEGDYGIKRGAEKLGISEDELIKRMEEAGYKVMETV